MQRLKRFFQIRFSHFQAKLLLAFLLCTLFPLTAISCISYYVSYKIAEDKTILSTLHLDEQVNLQLNDRLKQAEDVADSIQYDMYSLTRAVRGDIISYLDTFGNVRNNIALYNATFDFLHTYIYLPPEQMGSEEQLTFRPLSELSDLLPERAGRPVPSGTHSDWVYIPAVSLPFILTNSYEDVPAIGCIRQLQNQDSDVTKYAYLILLDPLEFSALLTNTFDSSAITSYLLTDAGQIVASNDGPTMAEAFTSDKWNYLTEHTGQFFRDQDTRYNVVQLNNGWYHITEIPESYIKSNIDILLNTILITLLLTLPLTVIVIIMISKNLTRRITALSSAMEQFQLDDSGKVLQPVALAYPDLPESYDEIDRLGITFEQMQASLQESMKAILDFSLTEEKLKYQLLQSQINPHFLYNILGSIQSCQSIGKLDTAHQMIAMLTRFYRLTLRNSGELTPIRQELEIAGLYLEMEKLCHDDNLTWEFHTEDGVENFLMCRFTLQPFLENCILHGITEKTPQLHIRLDVMYRDETVLITIRDNGIGMSDEQLAALRSTLELETVDYERHFGIGNVNKRIKNPHFGSGTVQIDSQLYLGTTVIIEFMQMEGEDEKSNDCG